MRYDPKSAAQPGGNPGTYYFSVASVEEKVSGNGNEMLKVVLAVDANGVPMTVHDYLVNTPGGLWKAKMFCAEVSIDFDAGELSPETMVGKSGQCVLDYDKRDLEKVNTGEIEKAYLKVRRYGVHKEEGKSAPKPGVRRLEDGPPPSENEAAGIAPESDIPF